MDIHTAVAMAGDGSQQGEIQILHATPEQISQLQQAQHIQILSGDQVIGVGEGLHVGCDLYVCLCVALLLYFVGEEGSCHLWGKKGIVLVRVYCEVYFVGEEGSCIGQGLL